MADTKMSGIVRRHSLPALIGIAIFMTFLNFGNTINDWWRGYSDDVPASNWYEVYTLIIDDAVTGHDPRLQFRRDIKKDVSGTFNSSIYKYAGPDDNVGTSYCQGNGGADYKAGRELPPAAISLSWLMNREDAPCQFVPGIYKNVTTWTFTPEGYTPKRLRVESNLFVVKPK